MRFLKNRWVARCVLAVVIVLSLNVSGGGALSAQRAEIERGFYAASESISAELKEMASNAEVMASIARKYAGAEDSALLTQTDEAISALRTLEGPDALSRAADALSAAAENLYSQATGLKMNDTDAQDLRYAYKNYAAAKLRITHDGYHDAAAAFNQTLHGFPANLLGWLRGVRPLEEFV